MPGTTQPALANPASSSPAKPAHADNQQTTQTDGQAAASARSPQEQRLEEVLDLYLSQMSVADKVGQLFVISFEGNDTTPESDIAELIYVYRVGGIAISPHMHNFTNDKNTNTPENVARLINQLQAISYGIFLPADDVFNLDQLGVYRERGIPPSGLRALARGEDLKPLNIPLFIAVEQQGDNLPNTMLRQGFTELPAPMALGATWKPDLAKKVGRIVGQQLSAVGVNMLLGPNLDVVDQPLPDKVGGLGLFSFGGDPSWVSRMGRAYVTGVHEGGARRVLTIAGHFPGQGGSDRIPDQEIPTIQSSEQELRRIDLPPFGAVTRADSSILDDEGDWGSTDGLMSSHARYASQQGAVTEGNPRPISLATQLAQMLQGPDYVAWREHGLVMSNALGVPAIQKTFEPSSNGFPERRIALEAFSAGHDLLYLGEFGEPGNWIDQRQNITETIQFFRARYETNAEFQANVDAAVRRILRAKLRLYIGDGADLNEATPENAPANPAPAAGAETITETLPISGADLISSSITVAVTSTEAVTTALISPLAPADTQPVTATGSVTTTAPITNGASLPPTTAAITITYPITLAQAIPLAKVLVTEANLEAFSADNLALADADIREVSRSSIALLAPDATALSEPLPDPPQADERILIFTNSRLQQECTDCTAEVAVAPDALADIIRNLYGVEATGQISDSLITSLAFSDLMQLLDNETTKSEATPVADTEVGAEIENFEEQPAAATPEAGATVEAAPEETPAAQANLDKNAKTELRISEASWIIFAMLDVNPNDPNSAAVKRFLSERGDQLPNKRVIVLALNAPYFLDSTEVSRLTAYIGVNSKIKPFIEQAVLTLFKASPAAGAPPVNVPGTHFSSLTERLQPNPNQILPLKISIGDTVLIPSPEIVPPADAESATEVKLQVGDQIALQVGPILDSNNNPVADGTPVEFDLVYESEGSALVAEPATTRNGFAQRDIIVDKSGVVRVFAISKVGENAQLAARSEEYSLNVADNPAAIAAVMAEATATAIAEQTPSGNAETSPSGAQPAGNEAENTPTSPVGEGEAPAPQPTRRVHLQTFFMALLTMLGMQSFLLIVLARTQPRVQLLRNMLWAMIMGLAAYIVYFGYIAFGANVVPGASWLQNETYPWGTVIIVFIAMLIPLLWLQLRHEQ
ncbi:MAG: glycoside hydrolase family 3 N-terminal domain-containing protein [Caldilineaceae bacterium]